MKPIIKIGDFYKIMHKGIERRVQCSCVILEDCDRFFFKDLDSGEEFMCLSFFDLKIL